MQERYTVKDSSKIEKIILMSDLHKLPEGSFIVVIVKDTLCEEELFDLREELDEISSVPCILSTKDLTIHEVVDKLNTNESVD